MEDLTRGKSEPEGRSVFIACRISFVLYLTPGLRLLFHVALNIPCLGPTQVLTQRLIQKSGLFWASQSAFKFQQWWNIFSITRPALDHRHSSKGLGKLYSPDCSSGVTETEAQTEILSKVPCRKLGYLPSRQCTSSQHGTNSRVWLIVAYFPLHNQKLKYICSFFLNVLVAVCATFQLNP